MKPIRLPTLFISHGGGPWPYIEDMRQRFAVTARALENLPSTLPAMEYDYYGFPEHTYHVQYPAPGSPKLASRVCELLSAANIKCAKDANRGFDHGVFVPMLLMYPQADIPIVLLSMKSSYDPLEHIRLGEAIAPLRDEGVLIVGSGLTYHNMRGFGRRESYQPSVEFEQYLNAAISDPDPQQRNQALVDWEQAPFARLVHPREDHLIPLMVAAGAAGNDIGYRIFTDTVFEVAMASYRFG